MKTLISFGWGGLLVLLGTVLLAWIGYNAFTAADPEARGRSMAKATIMAIVMIGVGVKRIRGSRRNAQPEQGADERRAA